MTEEHNDQPHDIKKDIFGSKLELKKILQTFFQVLKNVKVVVDDFYFNKGNYTKPVKYAISIIAPYLIIIQLFDIDMAYHILEASKQANDISAEISANPEIATFYNRYFEVTSYFTKINYEFLPIFYAVIYIPILAFWLKKFFKRDDFKFSYYYALGTYIMMTTVTITLLLFLISINGFIPLMDVMTISLIITSIFYIYGIQCVFSGGIIKGIFKGLLVIGLTFISAVVPMIVVIVSITMATM